MIREFYCPTRGTDAVVLTCITEGHGPIRVSATCGDEPLQPRSLHPPVSIGRGRGYHFRFDGLTPHTTIHARVESAAGREHPLRLNTLDAPPGPRLARIGLVADAHLTADVPNTYRLYAHSHELLQDCLDRLVDLGCDTIVALGDLTDAGTDAQLAEGKAMLDACRVPTHAIVGNHEYVPERFLEAFGLEFGYRMVDVGDCRLALLHTHGPSDLGPRSRQLRWLAGELDRERDRPTVVLSHYHLAEHPYLSRERSRTVSNWRAVADLIASRPCVLGAFAGHKNVPSRTDHGGVTHAVCAQPCQAPCGFDVIDVYADGIVRETHEIDRLDLMHLSRAALGDKGPAHYRHGVERARNFMALRQTQPPAVEAPVPVPA
ncbi:MAG: metallophosphoesterase [Planctomycetota bacterium]